jgi:hypothetical protein
VKLGRVKSVLVVAMVFLVLSVLLGIVSIYSTATGQTSSKTIIDNTFHLSSNEERRQGIGNFHGNTTAGNESIAVKVDGSDVFVRNFSIVTYGSNVYNVSTSGNITYTFPSGADYYEAIFKVDGSNSGSLRFQVIVTQPELNHGFAWLSAPAKVMFLVGIAVIVLVLLQQGFFEKTAEKAKSSQPVLDRSRKRVLVALLVVSLIFWLAFLVVNSTPLGTFDNWYTDHARHSYTAQLFLKDGLSVFSQPTDVLASADHSAFMFVTWPEMPHLYPIGSVLLFLPFSVLVESGVAAILVFKLEMGVFLVFAHVCLYFFFCRFFAQRPFPILDRQNANEDIRVIREGTRKQQASLIREYVDLALVIVGVYIVYTSLVTFAADGMFDAVPFLFALLAVIAFLGERYDGFLLLIGVSILFKYQTGIFLFPLIIVGIVKLLEANKLVEVVRNKAVVLAVLFACVSGFTAYLSAPYLIATRPELIMNGVNAFSPHAQIEWPLQAFAVLLTLGATLVYAVYMFNKNKLLSLSAVFLLLPTFCLPYFQNWYLPYLFIYLLIPQRKNEFTATIIWLIYMVIVLSYGGSGFNPQLLVSHFESMVNQAGMLRLGL